MNKSPFELLEENAFAYVAHRKQPETLQLSFGNVSLQLSSTEFA